MIGTTVKEASNRIFPKNFPLLAPWLTESSLSMIHSWRGTGKTFFSLGVCSAVSSSSWFLKWTAPERREVLYLDYEMGLASMMHRIRALREKLPREMSLEKFRIVTFEDMGSAFWNLANPRDQEIVENALGSAALLVIDNLAAALKPMGREHIRDAWGRMQNWLIKLRGAKKAVIIVQHTGKNGTQRGLSDIEDPLDTSIFLKVPDGHRPEDGTKFELHFEKHRNIFGKDVEPLFIELLANQGDPKHLYWEWQPLVQVAQRRQNDTEAMWG